jgi:hypothetical protein
MERVFFDSKTEKEKEKDEKKKMRQRKSRTPPSHISDTRFAMAMTITSKRSAVGLRWGPSGWSGVFSFFLARLRLSKVAIF